MTMRFGDSVSSKPARMFSLSEGQRIGLAYFLLLLVGGLWLIGIPAAAFCAVIALLVLAALSSAAFCGKLLFICLPFFNIMGVELGGTSLYYILIAIFTAKYLISSDFFLGKARILAILIIVASTIYNIDDAASYFRWIALLLPFVLLFKTDLFRRILKDCIYYLSISILLSSIIGLVMMNQGSYLYTRGYVYTANRETTTRFAGLIGDAVVYGQLISLAIAANTVYLVRGEGRRGQLTMSVSLVLFVFLTYSKTAILCVGICLMMAVLMYVRLVVKRDILVRDLVLIILIVLVVIVSTNYLMSDSSLFSIDALNTRLDSSDLLTSRAQIWEGYFRLWRETGPILLFKGIGFEAYSNTIVYSFFNHTHNIYIEAVTCFGVIESILLLAFVISCMVKSREKGTPPYIPTLVMLASGMVLHGFLEFPFFFEWLIALQLLDQYVAAEAITEGSD